MSAAGESCHASADERFGFWHNPEELSRSDQGRLPMFCGQKYSTQFKITSDLENSLCDHPQRFGGAIAAQQHGINVPLFPRIRPRLQPVANSIS
jgi:hypothetical protein